MSDKRSNLPKDGVAKMTSLPRNQRCELGILRRGAEEGRNEDSKVYRQVYREVRNSKTSEQKNSLLWGCPGHCRMLSGILGLYSLDAH